MHPEPASEGRLFPIGLHERYHGGEQILWCQEYRRFIVLYEHSVDGCKIERVN